MISSIQGPQLAAVLAEAFPDQPEIAAAFTGIAGNCSSPLWHRGPVWLQGASQDNAPGYVIADPNLAGDQTTVQNANYNLMVENPFTINPTFTQQENVQNFINMNFPLIVGNPPTDPPQEPNYTLTYVDDSTNPTYYYSFPQITTYMAGPTYISTIIYDNIIQSGKGTSEIWCEKEYDVMTGATGSFNSDDCTFTLTISKTKARTLVRCGDDTAGVDTTAGGNGGGGGDGESPPYVPGGDYYVDDAPLNMDDSIPRGGEFDPSYYYGLPSDGGPQAY